MDRSPKLNLIKTWIKNLSVRAVAENLTVIAAASIIKGKSRKLLKP